MTAIGIVSIVRSKSRCNQTRMATTLSRVGASQMFGDWQASLHGSSSTQFYHDSSSNSGGCCCRSQPVMGSKGEAKGLFAPMVAIARNFVGTKRFNQLRGKAIALHSQVITEFCKSVGADNKVRQGLIRVAKKNGEKLGFLA